MANPASVVTSGVKTPKIIENSKFKVRKDVIETTQDNIPTSSNLPAFQDRILHFKVT